MRPELEQLRRLEAYLLDCQPMATPPNSPFPAADVQAQRQAYQALHQAGRQQLRQELAAMHQQLYGPAVGRWAWVGRGLRLVFARWTRPTTPRR